MPTVENPELQDHSHLIPSEETLSKLKDQLQNSDVLQPKDTASKLTFGEQLVGITFNPASDDKVAKAKLLCADLADLLIEDAQSSETTILKNQLRELAINQILLAQMSAVKVLTLKY